jgi:16S rRNA (cytosine967-C5)-methyltransferase
VIASDSTPRRKVRAAGAPASTPRRKGRVAGAPARRAAIDALRDIEDGPLDLGGAMARARQGLTDERDRALLLEIVTGTLRMRGALDYQIAQRTNRPLPKLDAAVLRILRAAAFQLLYLSRLPASAVINDSVELTRRAGKSSAAGLVNAVLRKLSRERDDLTWPDDLAVVHAHPRWLVDRWRHRYGDEATRAWLQFNNRPAALCLAVNTQLSTRDAVARELAAGGVTTAPTARSRHGLTVIDGHPLGHPAFAEGRVIVQDEASQLIAELVDAPVPARMLDLCASPGGKTLHLSAGAGVHGIVIAADVRPRRVRVLRRTVDRCRLRNTRVVHVAAEGPLPFRDGTFDAILIDAPCSGLGTVRRDPDIKWKRVAEDLPGFAAAQRRLLARAAPLARAGGCVVYSTCSSEPEENEQVVEAFLGEHAGFRLERAHQTLPFRDGLEAFFGAVLRHAEPSA